MPLSAQDLFDQSSLRIDPIQQSLHFEAADFGVARTYSSQSNFVGIFGVGWCSELDSRVEIYIDQSYRLRGCDPNDGRSLDPRMAGSRLKKTSNGFERTRADEAREVFSAQGELVRIENRHQGRIEVRRSAQLSRWAVRIGNQPERQIEFNQDGRVSNWGSIQFTYKEDELTAWHEGGRERVEVEYDRLSNLRRWSKWTRNLREIGEIDYDIQRDEVKTFNREVGSVRQEMRIRRGAGQGSTKTLEWKRGSETNPARILYDEVNGPIDIRGSSDALKSLLSQIRDPQTQPNLNPKEQ
jgi:hypothetical protein